MKALIISAVILILTIATVSFLAMIVKNKGLSINKKILWSVLVVFLPIVGGFIYLTRKGEANA